jgi:hypothetical protein
MPDKSYVTMEQHLCTVCGHPYDTGALLLDKRLRERFDMNTITGMSGMCEEHQKLHDDGYVALVGVKNSGSGDILKQEHAQRTGSIMHLKKDSGIWEIIGLEVPEGPMVFAEEELIHAINNSFGQPQD